MPRERRDLITGNVVTDRAKWTNEEIIVWLDDEDRREEQCHDMLESDFIQNGNRHIESGSRDVWARLEEEHARDSERYTL